MTTTPDLDTLPQRMRYAARVLQEVFQRDPIFDKAYRSPATFFVHPYAGKGIKLALREVADKFEAEDSEAAEHQAQAEELAHAFLAHYHSDSITEKLRIVAIARDLIADGWRKP